MDCPAMGRTQSESPAIIGLIHPLMVESGELMSTSGWGTDCPVNCADMACEPGHHWQDTPPWTWTSLTGER
jgi:hypothetical protein